MIRIQLNNRMLDHIIRIERNKDAVSSVRLPVSLSDRLRKNSKKRSAYSSNRGLSLLFLDFTGTIHHWLGWMAKVQALEAVLALNVTMIALLVVLTLVFGRIYCSDIPLIIPVIRKDFCVPSPLTIMLSPMS